MCSRRPVENITFSTKYNLQLDLYLPVDAATARLRPAMVAVHGGGGGQMPSYPSGRALIDTYTGAIFRDTWR